MSEPDMHCHTTNSLYPWNHPDLRRWSIVGMNHYGMAHQRRLFVAMTWSQYCIRAESSDETEVWQSLLDQANAVFRKACEGVATPLLATNARTID